MHVYIYTYHFTLLILAQVFYDKMKDSQQEIKSTVTVNTSDMAAKAHEDKEGKDIDKLSRKRGSGMRENKYYRSEIY